MGHQVRDSVILKIVIQYELFVLDFMNMKKTTGQCRHHCQMRVKCLLPDALAVREWERTLYYDVENMQIEGKQIVCF